MPFYVSHLTRFAGNALPYHCVLANSKFNSLYKMAAAADVVGAAEPVNLVEQETGGETLRALGDEPVQQNDLELITEMALRAEKAAAAFRIQHNEDLVVTFGE